MIAIVQYINYESIDITIKPPAIEIVKNVVTIGSQNIHQKIIK